MTTTIDDDLSYISSPIYKYKFKPQIIKDIIKSTLIEKLTSKIYHTDDTSKWTKEIASIIKNKCKALNLPRYKYLVQVVIGESKGEGVKMGTRCFWDDQTDGVASETFINVFYYIFIIINIIF